MKENKFICVHTMCSKNCFQNNSDTCRNVCNMKLTEKGDEIRLCAQDDHHNTNRQWHARQVLRDDRGIFYHDFTGDFFVYLFIILYYEFHFPLSAQVFCLQPSPSPQNETQIWHRLSG